MNGYRLGTREVATVKYKLIGTFACLLTAFGAHARQSSWTVQASDDGTVVARVAMDHRGTTGTTIMTVLNVGYGRKNGCQPEFGIAMLKGSGYGSPVGKISPPSTEPITLVVDESRVPTPAPFLVKYDNGIEAVFAASPEIVQALVAGTTATVQIVSGTPTFEFPLTGAGAALDAARRQCMSSESR